MRKIIISSIVVGVSSVSLLATPLSVLEIGNTVSAIHYSIEMGDKPSKIQNKIMTLYKSVSSKNAKYIYCIKKQKDFNKCIIEYKKLKSSRGVITTWIKKYHRMIGYEGMDKRKQSLKDLEANLKTALKLKKRAIIESNKCEKENKKNICNGYHRYSFDESIVWAKVEIQRYKYERGNK